jgi:hypothetical protein
MDGGNSHKTAGAATGGAGDGAHARGPGDGAEAAPQPDLAALARDWIELWQSELAALAADPETAETWARLAALWAGMAASGLAAMPRGFADERFGAGHTPGFGPGGFFPAAPGFAGAAQPPRPAPASAPPDAGGAAAHRLLERVLDRLDAIERRLAEMEQRGGGSAGGAARPGSRRRGA